MKFISKFGFSAYSIIGWYTLLLFITKKIKLYFFKKFELKLLYKFVNMYDIIKKQVLIKFLKNNIN